MFLLADMVITVMHCGRSQEHANSAASYYTAPHFGLRLWQGNKVSKPSPGLG
jgi:hypothetical protein